MSGGGLDLSGVVLRQGDFTLRAELAVPAGALCAVIGPSGAGKSTLLAAIAGFVVVEAGTIAVDGRALGDAAPAERPVTMLFQENNLFPHLDIAGNVGLGLRPTTRLSREERAAVDDALAAVGLDGMGARLPEALSGGQRQRAALARALLRDRPVLLLDEPFSGLGPGLRAEMLALVRRLGPDRGKAVLMVTHAPEEARGVAELTAFCDAGRVGPARPTVDLFADPPPGMAAYLGVGGA
jgi:thiamine transport system ATP-binding protein